MTAPAWHEKHLCRHCGRPNGEHRTVDHRCPGAPAFPSWPKLRDEVRASALFDKRLAKHWSRRSTAFAPV